MSKTLFVAITDTHLDEDNFEQVYSCFKQAIKVVKDNNLKELFHLGDHFTSRISQRLDTLLSFKEIIKLLENEQITLVTIPGNHDKTNQSSENSYLDVFRSPNLTVFRKGFHSKHRSGVDIFFLPYFKDEVYNEQLKELTEISKNSHNKTCLLTHVGINGVLNNDGNKINNVVEVGKFKGFDLTLIGHYHNHTKVTNKVIYIGSSYPRNFGEDSDKGCVVVDENLNIERIKFKFTEYEKVKITNFETAEVQKLIDFYKKQKDKKIRFEFVGNEEDFLKIEKRIINSQGIEVTTVNIKNVKENVEEEQDVKLSLNLTKKDLIDKFSKFCKKTEIKKEESKEMLKYLI